MSAGDTPEILAACPKERGLIWVNFSRASLDRDLISLKFRSLGMRFEGLPLPGGVAAIREKYAVA